MTLSEAKESVGNDVKTIDGHYETLLKVFIFTGHGWTAHIMESDGSCWYCPVENILNEERPLSINEKTY